MDVVFYFHFTSIQLVLTFKPFNESIKVQTNFYLFTFVISNWDNCLFLLHLSLSSLGFPTLSKVSLEVSFYSTFTFRQKFQRWRFYPNSKYPLYNEKGENVRLTAPLAPPQPPGSLLAPWRLGPAGGAFVKSLFVGVVNN